MNNARAHPCRITGNARLDTRNTFRVGATAPRLVEVVDAGVLPGLFADTLPDPGSTLVLGAGSNLLFAADPPGTVLSLAGRAISVIDDDGARAIVRAEAGMDWHGFVLWSLDAGLSGLENLALIPGTVGAAPVQNIGAYGVEVREYIHTVEAFDRMQHRLIRLDAAACAFAYRDSLFKRAQDRYIITAVEFTLPRAFQPRLEYAGIREELHAKGAGTVPRTARELALAIMRIRRRKLPDPAQLGNAGSFFRNPHVLAAVAAALCAEHPAMPVFPGNDDGTRKLSAAWLIEQCGWKGHREGDAGVAPGHALVLVNYGHASGLQLLDLARHIAASVQARFGVAIEPEPRIIGAAW